MSAVPRQLDRSDHLHVLSRLTFGPTRDSLLRIEEQGFEKWLDQQLRPGQVPDAPLEKAIEPYRHVLGSPREMIYRFPAGARQEQAEDVVQFEEAVQLSDAWEILATFQMVELTRHIVSHQQAKEVMVDFWSNHFNVNALKADIRYIIADYIDQAIRPHALGKFEDLLSATAHHGAMLVYLDNRASKGHMADRGLNENYAREILELHTVGMEGGYTQADIRSVAHVFAGWGSRAPREGDLGFVFRPQYHSGVPRVVMGRRFEEKGQLQGEALIRFLAHHPATAQRIANKLCLRFVGEAPPQSCVDAARSAFLGTGGNISEVVRAIVQDSSFWAKDRRNSIFKTPLYFTVSAARALGAVPDGSAQFSQELLQLGEAKFRNPIPTGYPENHERWATTAGMVLRARFAARLVDGEAGLVVQPTRLDASDPSSMMDELDERLLAAPMPDSVKLAFVQTLSAAEPELRERLALVATLSSPEFQMR